MNYKNYLIEEIYYCVKHIGFSYTDVMNMSVYERRNYLSLLLNENQNIKEAEEQSLNKTSSNGSRTTRISGDQLKAKLKSGEIPNQ